jgi:hypothetical protein
VETLEGFVGTISGYELQRRALAVVLPFSGLSNLSAAFFARPGLGRELILQARSPSRLAIEQHQPRDNYLLYGIYDERQNLVRHDLVWFFRQPLFQTASPCDAQFRIDVDNVDSCCDGFAKVIIVSP